MKPSILPVFVIIVFGFCVFITLRAKRGQSITSGQAASVYLLLLSLFGWTLISAVLGLKGIHTSKLLLQRVPLLWQACVPVFIAAVHLSISRSLRSALRAIADSTPTHWPVFFQALRIGALGGVIKGIKGEVTSGFVFWVGVPDLLYGISAVILGWLVLRDAVGRRFLLIWNLIGPAIILLPTFGFMRHWMNEPGFTFIMEFPMVLAPSIVVPIFIFLNLLSAWQVFRLTRKEPRTK